ncbi:MAG: cellulase N-terminal Ig-like domain-containing protein [Balneolaceae bacterium]|nr:cellulase N-terminal Ig-like domain-containing protein [Balneolaceae bacterium]
MMKKNISFVILIPLFTLISFTPSCAQQIDSENLVRLNQIGFYPDAPKVAIVEQELSGPFYLVSVNKEDTLFTGQLSESIQYQYGPRMVTPAYFSEFTRPGS